MNSTELDFKTVLEHHEYDNMVVRIEEFGSTGDVMDVDVCGNSIRLTQEELTKLVEVFFLYKKAKGLFKQEPAKHRLAAIREKMRREGGESSNVVNINTSKDK